MVSQVKKNSGATLVEYALLVALLAVIIIAALTSLGSRLSERFSGAGSAVDGGTGSGGPGPTQPPSSPPPPGPS